MVGMIHANFIPFQMHFCGMLEQMTHFFSKPIGYHALAEAVRRVLDKTCEDA